MHKAGVLGKSKLIGLVKEIAPCSTAKDDLELGVAEFQNKYFNNYPLYLDETKAFYDALGNRKITELEGSWNPIKVFEGFKAIGERIKAKNLEGNMRGEGLILGGIIVIDPKQKEAVYTYYESTGKEIPNDDIIAAVRGIKSSSPFKFF